MLEIDSLLIKGQKFEKCGGLAINSSKLRIQTPRQTNFKYM
jgi:hypothetical protein